MHVVKHKTSDQLSVLALMWITVLALMWITVLALMWITVLALMWITVLALMWITVLALMWITVLALMWITVLAIQQNDLLVNHYSMGRDVRSFMFWSVVDVGSDNDRWQAIFELCIFHLSHTCNIVRTPPQMPELFSMWEKNHISMAF